MYPHKKPVRRKTFLQGSQLLQVFKTVGGKLEVAKAIKTPKFHNKQEKLH